MGSSGGGGSGSPPRQPTPAGQITGFGAATAFNPAQHSVLSDNMGWADVDEIDAASARAAQQAAAPPPQMAGGGMPAGMDAFAQQLLDYNKQQKFNQGMMSMGGPFARYGIGQMNKMQAPVAQGPAQQLMLQALQQRQQGGGGTSRMQSSRR